MTKSIIDTIDESYEFIINIFEEQKAFIKNIELNKSITLILKVYIHNKETDIEIKLLYDQNKKDSNVKKLNNDVNRLKNEIQNLKDEISILRKDVELLKNINVNRNINNISSFNGNNVNTSTNNSHNVNKHINNYHNPNNSINNCSNVKGITIENYENSFNDSHYTYNTINDNTKTMNY